MNREKFRLDIKFSVPFIYERNGDDSPYFCGSWLSFWVILFLLLYLFFYFLNIRWNDDINTLTVDIKKIGVLKNINPDQNRVTLPDGIDADVPTVCVFLDSE